MGSLVQYHLEEPVPGKPIDVAEFRCRGWFAAELDSQFTNAGLCIDGNWFSLLLTPRDDVQRAFPQLSTIGFTGLCPTRNVDATGLLQLSVTIDDTVVTIPLTAAVDHEALERFTWLKRAKLERIRPLLACPHCRARTLTDKVDALTCTACGADFPKGPTNYDFLSGELKQSARIESTANVSANPYDAEVASEVEAQIARDPNFLVLDAGSGYRSEYNPNIVNFEVVSYQTTDVLGVCEVLPFINDSFDAVLSFAVLEHVRDPFAAARELVRVLKPGGMLYAVVPFLQPVHGYPNHYYNMTAAGLRNLFSELDILSSDVPQYGRPIFGLTWIVGCWLRALPPAEAAEFSEMHIGDLLAEPWTFANSPFVAKMPESANEEMACATRVFARKPMQPK